MQQHANSMNKKNKKNRLTVIEREYLKLLRPELRQAVKEGDPTRAASFAKEIARLQRKKSQAKRR